MPYVEFEYSYNDDMEDDYDQDLAYEREIELNDLFEEYIDLVMCFEGRAQDVRQKLTTVYNFTELHELFIKSKRYPSSGSKRGQEVCPFRQKTILSIKKLGSRIINDPRAIEYSEQRVQQWTNLLNSIRQWEEFLEKHPNGFICAYWYKEKREY